MLHLLTTLENCQVTLCYLVLKKVVGFNGENCSILRGYTFFNIYLSIWCEMSTAIILKIHTFTKDTLSEENFSEDTIQLLHF